LYYSCCSLCPYCVDADVSQLTDDEINAMIDSGEIDAFNGCSPREIYSFSDDTSIRRANFEEFPDLAEVTVIGNSDINY